MSQVAIILDSQSPSSIASHVSVSTVIVPLSQLIVILSAYGAVRSLSLLPEKENVTPSARIPSALYSICESDILWATNSSHQR